MSRRGYNGPRNSVGRRGECTQTHAIGWDSGSWCWCWCCRRDVHDGHLTCMPGVSGPQSHSSFVRKSAPPHHSAPHCSFRDKVRSSTPPHSTPSPLHTLPRRRQQRSSSRRRRRLHSHRHRRAVTPSRARRRRAARSGVVLQPRFLPRST
jgi:hypothetical protein